MAKEISMAKWVLALAALVLLFGCAMKMDVEQRVNRDGSSSMKQTLDLSSLIEYAKSAAGGGPMAGVAPNPDDTYSPSHYASLPSFESAGLFAAVNQSLLEGLAPGDMATIYAELANNGNAEVSNVTVQLFSKALVGRSPGAPSERIYYPLEPGGAKARLVLSAQVADVASGTYEYTLVATYDRGAERGLAAAKTFRLSVVSKEEKMEKSIGKLDEVYREVCTNATRKDPQLECAYSNGVMRLEKTISPGDSYLFAKEDGFFDSTYHVTITRIPAIGAGDLSGQAKINNQQKFSDGAGEAAALQPFLKISYTVYMPGKIETAPLGKISEDGSSATYDVWELYSKRQNIEILSREENSGNRAIAIGAGALAALAAIAGAYFLLAKKPATPAA